MKKLPTQKYALKRRIAHSGPAISFASIGISMIEFEHGLRIMVLLVGLVASILAIYLEIFPKNKNGR